MFSNTPQKPNTFRVISTEEALDEIERLTAWSQKQADDIMTLGQQVGCLTAENERLRADLAEFSRLKEYAKSLGQETYLELHAENERLRVALAEAGAFIKKHDGGKFFDRLGAVYKIGSALHQQQAVCPTCGGTGVEKATAGDGHHWCQDCQSPEDAPQMYQCSVCESDWGTDREAARNCCSHHKGAR